MIAATMGKIKSPKTRHRVPHLSCAGHVVLVRFEASVLAHMLALPTSPLAISRYGGEETVAREGALWIVETQYSRRYLLLPTDSVSIDIADSHIAFDTAVAALEIRKHIPHPTVESIFVLPAWRRKGIASFLIHRARDDYPDLMLDGKFTLEGAALFGYRNHEALR
jgi:GNAT superfamily N-acetyltransferase